MASNSQNNFLAENKKHQRKIVEEKKKKKSKNKSSSTVTSGRRTGFPAKHLDFSALLNDPNIKELAEHVEKYPSFNQIAEQLQETLHGATRDRLPKSNDRKYVSTMQKIINNLDLWKMFERLSDVLMQDPSTSSVPEIFVNPSNKGQRKQRMAHIQKDPCLKLILDEIENGGPAVMMRYWNDENILKMFGLAMGIIPYSEDAVASSENSGPDETEDMRYEDESIIHHTANVGDVELCCMNLKERFQRLSVSPVDIISQVQIESIHEEDSFVGFMLKLNLVAVLFRLRPRGPLPYYWSGYVRAMSCYSRQKSCYSSYLRQGAGREGLLTILTRVMEETPSVRFAQEFLLVLFLYHSLCTWFCTHEEFDQEDTASFFCKS
ncbi:hypothetical protein MTR_3g113040 [Medicago truncatula]|uniref:Uncharacterized protein n=1 Tax=Medicago truncatula TaxID=3880 RepID=G7J4N2_MEDTR|nr:hypothetical protein MTR_3g113040 [Medicago truncatula]